MNYFGYADSYEDWYDFKPSFNECLVNGERKEYDACSSNTIDAAKEFYGDRYEYIGSGFRTWHNGVENNWKEEHHFFIIKLKQ